MSLLHLIILGIVQGITEFLPISSSAHLILVPKVMGEADQGLLVDIGAHAGTLLAVLLYFWRDVLGLFEGAWDLVRCRETDRARLTRNVLIGSIPAGLIGFLMMDYQETLFRHIHWIIGANIVWALALYAADRFGKQANFIHQDMRWHHALIIGLVQVLAFIPGTSRSGITMTFGRLYGFARTEAAKFSMLLSMPITGAAVLAMGLKVLQGEASGESAHAFGIVAGLSFVTALFAIWGMMKWLRRFSFTPFVIYRLLLAAALYVWVI